MTALDAYSFGQTATAEPDPEPQPEPEPVATPTESWWPAAWEQHEVTAEPDDHGAHEAQPVAQDTATTTALMDAPTEAPTLLPRRTRGAQLPDTGPVNRPADDRVRTAEDIRNSLNRFRAGVKRGRETDQSTDEGKDA